jgi:hypothetical protein
MLADKFLSFTDLTLPFVDLILSFVDLILSFADCFRLKSLSLVFFVCKLALSFLTTV